MPHNVNAVWREAYNVKLAGLDDTYTWVLPAFVLPIRLDFTLSPLPPSHTLHRFAVSQPAFVGIGRIADGVGDSHGTGLRGSVSLGKPQPPPPPPPPPPPANKDENRYLHARATGA